MLSVALRGLLLTEHLTSIFLRGSAEHRTRHLIDSRERQAVSAPAKHFPKQIITRIYTQLRAQTMVLAPQTNWSASIRGREDL